ncbi:hypothetical protein CJF42_11190 [Pseudoalteromonas sp. NBT06-2]|uniref:response regulator n=1 Tax=Pseudoalteromonas sp. NBT06-2 TaxID=2025950 RepID=UPI000BA67581|nr:response regulator [Pseudoalteromonas sp. NBT06-2]PAJ74344.1 hypothetical protein CJF42_11190 [Pseudoalteromonas sp. NBT06-2]
MFSSPEISFLKNELHNFINKIQTMLDNPAIEGVRRDKLEQKLIVTVSIVNKLDHQQAEKDNRSTKIRLLIVDDVESMRKIHRHYFMESGFKNIDLAEDGNRAFLMMKKAIDNDHPYDLIISDWEMPKVSGLTLLKKIRIDKDLWRTPFYLISSLSEKKHILNGINMGATGYMVKPVNQKMILDKFKSYFK